MEQENNERKKTFFPLQSKLIRIQNLISRVEEEKDTIICTQSTEENLCRWTLNQSLCSSPLLAITGF